MSNAKISVNKNRKLKIVFCYIGLVVLVILLFLPVAFRAFIHEKPVAKQKEIIVLSCQKLNESVSSTFLDGIPQNILYTIKGDLRDNPTPDESTLPEGETQTTTAAVESDDTSTDNQLMNKIKKYSEITYDEVKETTSFRLNVDIIKGTSDYETIFNTVDNQETYYKTQGFSCIRTTA